MQGRRAGSPERDGRPGGDGRGRRAAGRAAPGRRSPTIAGLASVGFLGRSTGPVRQFDVTLTLDQRRIRACGPAPRVTVDPGGQAESTTCCRCRFRPSGRRTASPIVYVQTAAGFEARAVKVALSHREPRRPRGPRRGRGRRARRPAGRRTDRRQARPRPPGPGAREVSAGHAPRRAPRHARGGLDLAPRAAAGIRQPARAQAAIAADDARHDLRRRRGHRDALDRRRRAAAGHRLHRAARRAQRHRRSARSRRLSRRCSASARCRPGLSLPGLRSIQANVDGIVDVDGAQAAGADQAAAEAAGRRADGLRRLAGLRSKSPDFASPADGSSTMPTTSRRRRSRCSDRPRPPGLFGGADPLGQFVKVNQQWFRVIGIAGPQLTAQADVAGAAGAGSQQPDLRAAHVGAAPARGLDRAGRRTRSTRVYVNLTPDANVVTHRRRDARPARRLAPRRERFHASSFRPSCSPQQQRTKRLFEIVMVAIASISLLVGGIGIMNIMLASVMERTREIGVRRAVGATRRAIIRQFLVETTLITVTGGFVGTIVGIVLSQLVAYFAGWSTIVTVTSVAVACVVSVSIGIVFGLYPAMRAAKLDPVHRAALRVVSGIDCRVLGRSSELLVLGTPRSAGTRRRDCGRRTDCRCARPAARTCDAASSGTGIGRLLARVRHASTRRRVTSSAVCGAFFSTLSFASARPSRDRLDLARGSRSSRRRSDPALRCGSLSVGSTISVPGTGNDTVGAWKP